MDRPNHKRVSDYIRREKLSRVEAEYYDETSFLTLHKSMEPEEELLPQVHCEEQEDSQRTFVSAWQMFG